MRIELADGTTYDPNETETPMPEKTIIERAEAPGTIRETNINGVPGIEAVAPARTRLQIATDLDAAEREVTAAQLKVAEASQKVRDLERELKGFGVKKRAPKGTP